MSTALLSGVAVEELPGEPGAPRQYRLAIDLLFGEDAVRHLRLDSSIDPQLGLAKLQAAALVEKLLALKARPELDEDGPDGAANAESNRRRLLAMPLADRAIEKIEVAALLYGKILTL